MENISNQIKKAIGKEMNSAMANNFTKHGDSDSVSTVTYTHMTLPTNREEYI